MINNDPSNNIIKPIKPIFICNGVCRSCFTKICLSF